MLVFYEMPSPGQHGGNILSSPLPIPVPYLYSLHLPLFLLLFVGQEGERKDEEYTKCGMRKFLEASNVPTAWQPLSWEHTLMRPTYSSTFIFFFSSIVFASVLLWVFLWHYGNYCSVQPRTTIRLSEKKNSWYEFYKGSVRFQNLSRNITVWYRISQGSQITIHVYTCQLAYSYFLRACHFMATESFA